MSRYEDDLDLSKQRVLENNKTATQYMKEKASCSAPRRTDNFSPQDKITSVIKNNETDMARAQRDFARHLLCRVAKWADSTRSDNPEFTERSFQWLYDSILDKYLSEQGGDAGTGGWSWRGVDEEQDEYLAIPLREYMDLLDAADKSK